MMAKSLTVTFGGEADALIEFPAEQIIVNVPYTQVGENLYRLEAIPHVVESVHYQDVIEAEPTPEGHLRFLRVVERSKWRTFVYMVYPHVIESEWGQTLLRELEQRGGCWAAIFSALLHVCVPPGVDFNPDEWVQLTHQIPWFDGGEQVTPCP